MNNMVPVQTTGHTGLGGGNDNPLAATFGHDLTPAFGGR